jgi:hypothetical protein
MGSDASRPAALFIEQDHSDGKSEAYLIHLKANHWRDAWKQITFRAIPMACTKILKGALARC